MLRSCCWLVLASIGLVSGGAAVAAEAIRSGDGWSIHPQVVEEDWQSLVRGRNLAAGRLVQPQPAPNDHNTGSDLKNLTDGGLAGAEGRMWSDKRAMGWAYQPYARLTFDLEKSQPVGQVVMRLQVINKGSTLPGKITVSLSDDGQEFSPVRDLSLKTNPDDDPRTTYEALPFDPPGIYAVVLELGYKARYVQLDFALIGAMVTDELAILPATGAVKKIPPPPQVTTEYRDYVFDRRDQYRQMTAAGNLLLGKPLRYSPAPTQYLTVDDDDPLQLTDGNFCERVDEAIWFERGCVGWQGPPLATIFADLGEVQPIDSVVMRLLGGAAQNALEFPDEIKVLLSDDGLEYFEAAARHKRGLDDLSADGWTLPENKIPWVHNFRLPIGQRARYVAVQIAHKKQFIVSDEMAVVKGADDLPLFQPDAEKRVVLVTEGVAFLPVWGNVQPVCQNMPLRSRLQKQDARVGDQFDAPCQILLDLPDTLQCLNAGLEPVEVLHEGRKYLRYTIKWAGEGTELYLQSLLPAGETDVLYTSGDSGNGAENERPITWRSLYIPPARVPKRLHVSLSWADAPTLYKTWPNYLQAQRHLGFNGVGMQPCYWPESVVPEYQKILKEIRGQGFKLIQIESPAGAVAGDREHEETKTRMADGKFGDVCAAYRGQYYQKEHHSFARAATWIEPDIIFYDIEAYWRGSVNAELCEHCQQRYRQGNYASWNEYRAAMGREIHVDMKNKIDKALAKAGITRKIAYGSYRTEPITPLNDGLFSFDNTYPDLLQMAMPSLYVAGNPLAVAENIAANRARMQTNEIVPWLSTGCYGEYDPARTRDMILEAFANGASGVTYYWYGHFDAGHFKSHAEAINMVAPIEDIFMDGTPLTGLTCGHGQLKVCGMGLGQDLAVLVSNYQGVSPGTGVMVQTSAAPGSPVHDCHTGQRLGIIQPDGGFQVTLDEFATRLLYIGEKYIAAVANGVNSK
ncbi:MAG: discoidin domain-containing protein [Pirellulales bacterium]